MVRYDNPDTLQERKQALVYTLGEIAKWPHHNQDDSPVHSFDRRLASAINKGRVPEDAATERYDGEMDYETYTWQIVAQNAHRLVTMSEDTIREWVREQKNKENPITATDGSKGQWRAANNARILLGEWLLGETVEA